jgi:hypothetical protein
MFSNCQSHCGLLFADCCWQWMMATNYNITTQQRPAVHYAAAAAGAACLLTSLRECSAGSRLLLLQLHTLVSPEVESCHPPRCCYRPLQQLLHHLLLPLVGLPPAVLLR